MCNSRDGTIMLGLLVLLEDDMLLLIRLLVGVGDVTAVVSKSNNKNTFITFCYVLSIFSLQ